jgi:molecular chaperone DnaK
VPDIPLVMSSRIVGIDLGTTSSVVAAMHGSEAKLVPDYQGRIILPSLVVIKSDGSIAVGHEAESEAKKYSENNLLVASLKRSLEMSRQYDWRDTKIPVQVLMAMVLAELRVQAEVYFGDEVTRAVIAVPANFNFSQRQFTKEAALIAGLQPIRIVNEATASVCAMRDSFSGRVVAADLGGGTFDVSAIDFHAGFFEVVATSGDDHLGGDDFTATITKLIKRKIDGFKFDPDYIQTDRVMAQRFRDASEDAKKQLSSANIAKVSIPCVRTHRGSYETLACTISKTEFEAECQPLLDRIEKIVAEVWSAARFDKQPGQSPPPRAVADVPAEHTTVKQRWWAKLSSRFHKRTPLPHMANPAPAPPPGTPSFPEITGLWLIGNGSRVPAVGDKLHSKYRMLRPVGLLDLKTPVALGAAKIAGMLEGSVRSFLLLDATPNSLGIEVSGQEFARVIPKNTTIPTTVCAQTFTTTADNQTSVAVKILEGEHESSDFNKVLATLKIENILPARAGIPKIEIVFGVDAHGLLHVSAKDLATQRTTEVICDDFVLPKNKLNEYHQLVQKWIRRRRAHVTGLAQSRM